MGFAAAHALRRLERDHPDAAPGAAEDILARGWFQGAGRIWVAFNRDQIPAVSAGVTFFSLLALFPALGAFVSLYGLVANVADARRQILSLSGLLPGGAVAVIGDQMTRLTKTNHTHLGLAFVAGLLISIWSANAGVKALMAGLNAAYEARETRTFVRLNLLSLGFTGGIVVFTVIACAALALAPQAINLADHPNAGLLRWPVILVVMIGLLTLLYRYGPARTHGSGRWITPGSTFAAAAWMVMSLLFSLYVANFGHYDRTYGSLGAIVGFMTWIWLSVIVVLVGAELNWELEQRARARRD